MVQTPDRRYDPDLVPPEWSQWLKMTRLEPPSEEEIAGCLLLPAVSVQCQKSFFQLLKRPNPNQRVQVADRRSRESGCNATQAVGSQILASHACMTGGMHPCQHAHGRPC